jgi:septal ring factor EnvC (AmiA/AmiB activator)
MQAMLQEMQGKLEDTEMQKTGFSDHVKKLERDHTALERRIEELELDNERLSAALEAYRKR